MDFKFRVLTNFARIYFRGSLISHFFFNREKRQIVHTNEKYNKADLCFCLSMPSTHIPCEIRLLTKLFQCHSKGPLLQSERKKVSSHQRRKTTIFLNNKSSASLEKLGPKKLNKQKARYAVTGFILRVTKQGNKADH